MEEDFRAILLAAAGVTAIAATRIDWVSHPQGAGGPYVVLNLIDDAEGLTYAGPDGLSQGRVQVDCYAPSYSVAKALARAVRSALDGYQAGDFAGIFLETSRDTREGGSNEAERLFRCGLDFMTHWKG